VNFELSEDQETLREAASAFLGAESHPRQVVDSGGGWDRELFAQMAELGWCATVTPESEGGLGLGWVEAAVLLETVGRHLAPAPILGQLVAASVMAEPGLLDGSVVAAVSWDLTAPVPYAPSADVVVAHHDGVVGVIDAPRSEPLDALDLTRELGWVEPDALRPLEGVDPQRFWDLGAVAYAAELLGLCAEMLDRTVEYAKERVQFGQPIGSFQAVKHRCADMLVDVEGMRSATYWAAWCLAADHPDRSVAASVAKSWCGDASRRVMASALQVHGGIGFTWECDVHLYLKRAQLDQLEFGDAVAHRARLAGALRERVAAGESVI
jgi:alkylation response protein AidB-like acyl-CoA dehydrogenase